MRCVIVWHHEERVFQTLNIDVYQNYMETFVYIYTYNIYYNIQYKEAIGKNSVFFAPSRSTWGVHNEMSTSGCEPPGSSRHAHSLRGQGAPFSGTKKGGSGTDAAVWVLSENDEIHSNGCAEITWLNMSGILQAQKGCLGKEEGWWATRWQEGGCLVDEYVLT